MREAAGLLLVDAILSVKSMILESSVSSSLVDIYIQFSIIIMLTIITNTYNFNKRFFCQYVHRYLGIFADNSAGSPLK